MTLGASPFVHYEAILVDAYHYSPQLPDTKVELLLLAAC